MESYRFWYILSPQCLANRVLFKLRLSTALESKLRYGVWNYWGFSILWLHPCVKLNNIVPHQKRRKKQLKLVEIRLNTTSSVFLNGRKQSRKGIGTSFHFFFSYSAPTHGSADVHKFTLVVSKYIFTKEIYVTSSALHIRLASLTQQNFKEKFPLKKNKE